MDKGKVLIAKITRPRLSAVLYRERLFSLLDSGRTRPIIWVTGPPGAGKTTLVSSYLDAREFSALWYQVDEGDADIATFFYYMGMAAQRAAQKKRKPLPLLTPEYLPDIPTFTRRYFENLYSRLQPPFALVFDNHHAVPAESPFHEVVSRGLSQLPEGCFAVVISRAEPPPAFARLRAHEQMALIDDQTLRLTDEESYAIAELRGLGKETPATIRILHQRTEGWTAGLVLILELLKTKSMPAEFLAHQTPQLIFDYFAGEIFQKADRRTRDFLMKTAFLRDISVKAAEKLSGLSAAAGILEDLNKQNYFAVKHSAPEAVYQYHPLFREFLLARAAGEFTSAELAHIRKSAADILEAAFRIEDAVRLLRDIEDWQGISRIVLKHAPSMAAQGRGRSLEEWIDTLPRSVINKNAWFPYWRGVCRMPFNPSEARNHFEKAFQTFTSHRNAEGTFLSWAGVVDTLIFEWDDFTPLDLWIERLEKLIGMRKNRYPSPEIEMRVAFSMAAALMIRRPDHPKIGQWLEKMLALISGCGDINLRIQAFTFAALYSFWTGDHSRGAVVMDEVRGLARSPSASPMIHLTWMWLEAAVRIWIMASPLQGLETVSEALELAQKTGVHVWDHMLFALGVYASLVQGDFAKAEGFLKSLRATLTPSRRHGYSQYHYLEAWHAFLRGKKAQAETYAETALKTAEETGYVFPELLCRFLMARALHAQGKDKEAKAHLSRAHARALQTKNAIFDYTALLIKAQIAFDLSACLPASGSRQTGGQAQADRRNEEGLAFLRKAMRMGRERNYVSPPWWWHPEAMAMLCAKALENDIETEYVRNLVRVHRLAPEEPPQHIESWPWPVKIHTLGRFSLLLDDRPARFPGKAQHKPLELLKALIAFGGRDVGSERLAEVLWPDATGDAAQSALDTTLHRLRKIMGNDKAVELREGHVSLDPRCCWVDVWALERLMNQAEKSGSPELTEKALALYRGHFLGTETEQSWAIPLRERLRNRVLRHLVREGRILEDAKRWKKAAEFYQKVLEMDNLAEEAYQRLMLSYQRMGRRAEALAVYQRCRKILSSVFGIEPSPETEAIYRQIKDDEVVKTKNLPLRR